MKIVHKFLLELNRHSHSSTVVGFIALRTSCYYKPYSAVILFPKSSICITFYCKITAT